MRVLFIGDIVGESGRKVVTQNLLRIRDKYNIPGDGCGDCD